MSIRSKSLATGLLVVAAMALMAGRCWAVYEQLGPSKDEWKLKYDVQVTPADGDKLNVVFTLADEGRLKPIYSITVVAFSEPDRMGGRAYDVKAPIQLQPTADGQRTGQVQIRKQFADRAMIRILTQTVDGRRQVTTAAAYYDIPLRKFLNHRAAASRRTPRPTATPPAANVVR